MGLTHNFMSVLNVQKHDSGFFNSWSQLLCYWFHFFPLFRNGKRHEDRGIPGCGADCGGEELVVRGLQERDWCQAGLLADHLVHRTEGRKQSRRRQTQNDQNIPGSSKQAEQNIFIQLARFLPAIFPIFMF